MSSVKRHGSDFQEKDVLQLGMEEQAQPASKESRKKVFRGIRLDPDLDQALPALLERLKSEKGHRVTLSSFCRQAIRRAYNDAVEAINAAHRQND